MQKQNSFLEGLDEVNIDVEFQQTAETSHCIYGIAKRLEYNGSMKCFEREDFPHIMNFNTIPSTLNRFWVMLVSSISEEALREHIRRLSVPKYVKK